MRNIYKILILLLLSLGISQDRSVIFNTGTPEDLSVGYTIDSDNSIANRFLVNNSYVLEAMVFYMTTIPGSNDNSVIVSIREDHNGAPGELLSDLAQWQHDLSPLNPNGYNLIVTTDQCLYLDANTYYWIQIDAGNDNTNATWIYSNNTNYTYSASIDGGNSWNTEIGNAGACGIWAEQIFENAIIPGDINSDFVLNVVDIVSIVNLLLSNSFTQEQEALADLNGDLIVNVVDIVQLVNKILEPPVLVADFALLDINPASQFYTQNIGPSFFNGEVSCYYFGKQG